jgi:hypothetical protein
MGPIPRIETGVDWNANPNESLEAQQEQIGGDGQTDLQVVPVYSARLPEEDAAWEEWNPNISATDNRASAGH